MEQVIQVFIQEVAIPFLTATGVAITGYISYHSKKKLESNSKDITINLANTLESVTTNNNELIKKVENLQENLNKVTDKVGYLFDQFELKISNTDNLKKKLHLILEKIEYNGLIENDDVFKTFISTILNKVSEYYSELKSNDKVLGYKEKEYLVNYIRQIYNTTEIKININELLKLTSKLLDDYTINKTGNKENDLDLLLNLAGDFIKLAYKLYNGK